MASETDIAWAAGLFEGEGHFSLRRHQAGWRAMLEMGITSTDRDVVERFAAIVGAGNLRPKRWRGDQPHWKPQFVWGCSGAPAIEVAEQLLPHLGERRSRRYAEITAIMAASVPRERPCECCDAMFAPTRFDRERFCSERCRDRAKYLRRKYGVASEAEFAAR